MSAPTLPASAPAPASPARKTRRHPPKPTQRAYVGLAEAATYLDVAPKTLRKLIADGYLAAYRLGDKTIKVKLADLDAVLTPLPNGVV